MRSKLRWPVLGLCCSLALLASACSADDDGDTGGGDNDDASGDTGGGDGDGDGPSMGPCFEAGTYATCEEACVAANTVCVEEGCNGATIHTHDSLERCENPGAIISASNGACDEPLNDSPPQALQCCCQ